MHPIFFSSRGLILATVLWAAAALLWAGLVVWLESRTDHYQAAQVPVAMLLFAPWYGAFLFTCLANFYLCLRLPLESQQTMRIAAVQAISGAAGVGFWLLLGSGWAYLLDAAGADQTAALFLRTLPVNAVLGAIIYTVWILWHYVYLQARTREYQTSEDLQEKLLVNEVELQAIKAALHPHFLFNSLNMLANLSLVAPDKIHSLCVQMSDFLRYSVNYSNRPRVTVADEVSHVNNYLKIERERFGQRLQVRQFVDSASADIAVFPLLLFPLIENAIKHGIDSSPEPGFIEVSIGVETELLTLRVRNSCDPLGRNRPGTHLGLKSLQKRLARHYHQRATLHTQLRDQVFEATVQIPYGERTIP